MTDQEGNIFMDQERILPVSEVEVSKITDGLGFGEGGISHNDRTDVEPELKAKVEAIIQSDEILVAVDTDKDGVMLDDDGCGDGRGVKNIFEGVVERFKSLNRAKVFGGAPAMVASAAVGLGMAKGKKLVAVFEGGINSLKDKMIGFGGHTDEHAHGPNCGCGAIDKAPQAIANAVKYESEIRSTIEALGISDDGLDDVYADYRDYAAEIAGDGTYQGVEVMSQVVESGKVVKKLADAHNEMYIVLNTKRGMTVNQELIRRVSDGKIQVFGVDVWRMQDLAARLYDNETVVTLHPELDEAQLALKTAEYQHKAFLSELVYTLGVAATLTKGDLPVYAVSDVPQLVAA